MKRRILLGLHLSLVFAFSAALVAGPQGPRHQSAFPVPEWQRISEPASVGFCADRLAAVETTAKGLSTSAMMAVVGGRVLFEYGDVKTVSYLASVRKSVLAMLYGNYVKSGKVRLNKTLAEMNIDEHGGLTDEEKQATVEHLLGARSGIYHPASNAGDDLASAPPHGSQKPGTYFLYSNWDFNALGTIFEQETGLGIYDALEKDLAIPIGMQDFDKSRHRRTGNASRSRHLAYHMNFSTRDMARIGLVMLRGGEWNGKQIVPRDWAARIVLPVTRQHEMNPERHRSGPFGYGYLWWVWDGPAAAGAYEGAYTGIGAVGQYITVIPKLDMVIAHKTVPGDERTVTRPQYLSLVQGLIEAKCR